MHKTKQWCTASLSVLFTIGVWYDKHDMSQHKATKHNLSSPCHLTTLLSSSSSRNKDVTRSSRWLNTGSLSQKIHSLFLPQVSQFGKPNVSRGNKNKHGCGADRKKAVSWAGNLFPPHFPWHWMPGGIISSRARELKTECPGLKSKMWKSWFYYWSAVIWRPPDTFRNCWQTWDMGIDVLPLISRHLQLNK